MLRLCVTWDRAMEGMPADPQLPAWGPSAGEMKSIDWEVGREVFGFSEADEEDDSNSVRFSDPEEDDVDDAELLERLYSLDVVDRASSYLDETEL